MGMCEESRRCGDAVPEAEHHGDVGGEEQGCSDEPHQGENSRHETGLVEQGAEQECVHHRHQALSEEERPAVAGDQRLTGDQCVCSGSGLPQGHHRQQADDAGKDGGGFQSSGADEAQRGCFVLSLHNRVERDGGADAGKGHDHLQDAADDHRGVRAGAGDPVRIAQHGTVQGEGRDRDEAEQVQHAGGECRLPQGFHRDPYRCCGLQGWWPCRFLLRFGHRSRCPGWVGIGPGGSPLVTETGG